VKKFLKWLAVALIIITGVIHALDAQHCFHEAAYKGWLFYANAIGSLIAAYWIIRNKAWGWKLGLFIAAASFMFYIISRTIGLPYIPAEPDEWLEPLGIASLILESLFVLIFIWYSKTSDSKSL